MAAFALPSVNARPRQPIDGCDPLAQALRPPKRSRPLVAIVADNRGTETTDLLIPHAILVQSGVVDVVVVAPQDADIVLMPALTIASQMTLSEFDRRYPGGADYVIVPAMHHDERGGPIIEWIVRQAASRAIVAGICEGAKVLGRAGLLNGKNATTHWYAIDDLRKTYPAMQWIPNRRYVVDGSVVTTTGVTASIPVSLLLVEAIGGRQSAQALANQLGVSDYSPSHDSGKYHLNAARLWRVAKNTLALWRHETIGIQVDDGVSSLALALTADPWGRTFRSSVIALAQRTSVTTSHGLVLRTVAPEDARHSDFLIQIDTGTPPVKRLDAALTAISQRYGPETADLVALQLEYPWQS
ncbi:DJ-1/PfpI family protein [Pandoraea bronchicola]|uniref:Isonitrile hydratase n=1 Tax=Pandoraea bronchicola TaxID=2508287 RepID=A0A5E5BZ20_9BURK|nr:DJ-1/PfpI family protein [Pandoraea bronchicola]VVE90738.1 Isonitrile hydratase [Pandoraea bronchicola]